MVTNRRDAEETKRLAYTMADFCRVLGIGRTSAWMMLRNGHVNGIKLAGRVLIPATEVERLLAEAPSARIR